MSSRPYARRRASARSVDSAARAVATPHMLTSLECFLRLRRAYGLSLRRTCETITHLALTLLRG